MDGVRCMIMRGGTSKGAYFLETDLPADSHDRDNLLLRMMGTPDPRQIDGIGGAHPLTSKVAVVAPSTEGGSEVEYLFLQLGVDEATVSDRQNCGNLLAGIAPFALERGLVELADGEVSVRIRMLNSDSIATAHFRVKDGRPVYDGETAISGVPGTAAPIRLDFEGIAGGSTGALFPSGNIVDVISGAQVTLVDNGMPVVVMRADGVGVTGYESCPDLESNQDLLALLEKIRLEAGEMMNLGDVSTTTVPKLALVAPPAAGGQVSTRTFIPHRCHQAIGVLTAVSVATACLVPETPGSEVSEIEPDATTVTLEHPSGTFDTHIKLSLSQGIPSVEQAGIVRTARKLMDGLVYPRSG
jgi:4-oxalomesaconate tautomerase